MLHPIPPGMARPTAPWVRTLVVLAALLAVALLPASAAAASNLPAQGMYDTCIPQDSRDGCSSRLRLLASSGFKVVQPMGMASEVSNLANMLSYANNASAHGLKVIWNVRPGLSDGDLATLVTALRVHPSTWGYYISDEPSQADHDIVAAFNAKVQRLDPHHQRLIMGCGNCYGGEGSVNFMADIDATLGTDIYPVWEQAPDQPIVARKVRAAAEGLRRVADSRGRKTVVALQAFRWGDSHYDSQATGIGQASRFPTRREVEDQRNAAIEGGHPDLILWFTLNQTIGWEPGQRPWYWSEPSDKAARWANLSGGAFAPYPGTQANKRPVARFTVRTRPAKRIVRLVMNGKKSYDPDGKIVRYRWYTTGRKKAVCAKRLCWVTLRGKSRRKLKLVVTDSRGARSSRVRWIGKRRR